MLITEAEYEKARALIKENEEIVNLYFKQKDESFKERDERFKKGEQFYTDEELFYSAASLCPCGHGLAYPKGCGPHHHWDCSAILKGIADKGITHEAQLPFAFYDIKGESEYRGTTRGVYLPKKEVTK